MTISGYDAAFPPSPAPQDQVVMGYIGGDTPHVWSLADWNSQPARYRIPIWTRDNPGGFSGTTEAQAALSKLDSLGAPHGIYVVIDYEMAVDAAYVQQFDAVMQSVGNKVALYGSKSTLFQNPAPSGGYFPADITDAPHLYPGTVMTQYEFAGNWDDDTVASNLPLWDTQPGVTLNWTDVITGPNGRPGGNSVSNILTDIGRLRDYLAGDASAAVVYGPSTPLGGLVAASQLIAGISQKVDALASPTVDPAALATAVASALQDPAILKALAHAFAVELHGDLPAV